MSNNKSNSGKTNWALAGPILAFCTLVLIYGIADSGIIKGGLAGGIHFIIWGLIYLVINAIWQKVKESKPVSHVVKERVVSDTHYRILHIHPSPVILKFVRANLEARGFVVTTVEDSEAGLKAVEETSPDLVLMEIVMPGIDGVEVCRRIREWSDMPIVILTSKKSDEAVTTMLNLGANDYITMPFDISDLIARVQAVLDGKSDVSVEDAISRARASVRSEVEDQHDDCELKSKFTCCPNGHTTIKCVPITYGLVEMTPELIEAEKNYEIAFGGCEVWPNSPRFRIVCTTCEAYTYEGDSNWHEKSRWLI
ncbi:MAG: response regulator [bacterium]|nr:response regulator [bacterium]